MFVSPGRSSVPYPVFRAALDAGDLDRIRALAAEMGPIHLADALRICLLMRDGARTVYQRAAVRWLGRFALEARAVSLDELQCAAAALERLPLAPHDAMDELSALCVRHGLIN